MSILNEVEFQYSSGLDAKLKPFLGRGLFIHFGQTPRMGVNTAGAMHGDPHGIYFYDLDWLVKHPNFINGQQYGTHSAEYKYWTVVELDKNTTGIRLKYVTAEDVDNLAEQNHWPDWDETKFELIKGGAHTPAALLWAFVRSCAKRNAVAGKVKMTQNAALRGFDYVWDDGLGIIHSAEPNQLLVMHPRSIRVVGTGDFIGYDNYQARKSDPKNPLGDMKLAVVEMIKRLRGEYGGELSWNKNTPTLRFTKNNAIFELTYATGGYDGGSLHMDCQWGRARKNFYLAMSRFKSGNMEMAVSFFADVVERISALAAKGKDLLFRPAISEADARAALASIVEDGSKITTEISNESKTMTVEMKKNIAAGKGDLMSIVYISVTDKTVRYNATVKMNAYHVAHARGNTPEELAAGLKTTMEEQIESNHPKNTDKYSRKFYYEEELKAFVGMVADLSGIRSLQIDYSSDVDLWRDYKDKAEIYREANRIY